MAKITAVGWNPPSEQNLFFGLFLAFFWPIQAIVVVGGGRGAFSNMEPHV